jgi:hypothetical protein
VGQNFRKRIVAFRPLIGTVGKELFQERVHPEQGCKKQDAAVAILRASQFEASEFSRAVARSAASSPTSGSVLIGEDLKLASSWI